MTKYSKRRVMIDLETTSLSPMGAVWQIGYHELGGSFKGLVYLNPYHQMGRRVDDETLTWLGANAPDWEAAQRIFPTLPPNATILRQFTETIKAQHFDEIWCKGADVDMAILRSLLSDYSIPLPWHYTKQCCMRAYLNGFPEFKINFDMNGGNGHNGLWDAEVQNECLGRILDHLGIL